MSLINSSPEGTPPVSTTSVATKPVRSLRDIPGWFPWIDQRVFEHFLSKDAVVPHGDLVELGVYQGKSAALIGQFKGADETFTVCDLFDTQAADDQNRSENSRHYPSLNRAQFERNYLALFDELPVVIHDFSSVITKHVAPHSVRFIHIDASHLYEHVKIDIESARALALPGAVVVFDDYRTEHCPGVGAAVWSAVERKELKPICVTPQKLYATFGDVDPHQRRLEAWLVQFGRYGWDPFYVEGQRILRLFYRQEPKAKPAAPQMSERIGKLERRLAAQERAVRALQDDRRTRARTLGRRLEAAVRKRLT